MTFVNNKLRRPTIVLAITILSLLMFALSAFAQPSETDVQYSEQFFRGEVVKIIGEGEKEVFGTTDFYQILEIQLAEGPNAGEKLKINYSNPVISGRRQLIKEGDRVVTVRSDLDGEVEYEVYEPYRLPSIFIFTILFIVLAVLIAGRRGASALIGLAATLFILIKWIIPGIVAGGSPIFISFTGAIVIAAISIYLSHGFNKRTSVALVSTLITLLISFVLTIFSVSFSSLYGMGSEDAAYLASFGNVDLRGLLLGAIVIGTLGVLDDITIAQTTIVDELKKADKKFGFRQLYRRSSAIGKEHIASMINTLVIAYVGAAFPIFLLITKSPQPLWVILNNEFLAEEIVRTLVGSATLILAVPISTLLAAWVYSKRSNETTK